MLPLDHLERGENVAEKAHHLFYLKIIVDFYRKGREGRKGRKAITAEGAENAENTENTVEHREHSGARRNSNYVSWTG